MAKSRAGVNRSQAKVGGIVKLKRQTVGNVGLFYACYKLSRLGWNVMPTSRNARGIDILAYSQDASRKLTFQVKALSKRSAIGMSKPGGPVADFLIVCRDLAKEMPDCFILSGAKANVLADKKTNKKGEDSYWIEARVYETEAFHNDWSRVHPPASVPISDSE